jgi:hypothetical protein
MTSPLLRPRPAHGNASPRIVLSLLVCALLAACASTTPAPHTGNAPGTREQTAKGSSRQLNFKLPSGVYRCESGQQVEIQRNAADIGVSWQGSRHTLRRYDSESGLPRFEDRDSGLTWIDLPWKSVLMDSRSGRPLANECKAAKG